MKHVAIEGGCYAEKTTTINYLANEGMSVLSELKMRDGLPSDAVLPPGLEGYKAKIDAWLRAEEKRTQKIDSLRSQTGVLVADRSVMPPVLASHDFGIRYGLGDPEDRRQAFAYGAACLTEAQSAGRIVLPTNVLVMVLTDSDEFY